MSLHHHYIIVALDMSIIALSMLLNVIQLTDYLMYMGLYNSHTYQRIKPTTSGTEFKNVTVKLAVMKVKNGKTFIY